MSEKAKKDLNLEVPHYAALVVVDSDRKQVLLAKRTEDGLWTGPGGGGHWGETPEQTAVREAFEEANLRIDPAELTPLPSNLCKNGKICHCFLVVLNKVPELSVVHDPDREVRAWRWFSLDERLPETSEARARTLIHAKMKLFGLIKSRGEGSRGGKVIGHTKSGKPIYDDHKSPNHVSFDSQDHSDAADARNKLVYQLMESGKGTADPQVKRHMSRRDFHRMASESMKKSTLRKLTPDEILQGRGLIELIKSRKPFPIGTVRDWGGQKYVKHADGWVAVGGKHHGKLMGKFKDEPTHTEHASLHVGKQPVPDTKDPHTLFAEMGAQAFADGEKPIPAQNKKLMEALKQHPDQISELMEAWTQGWHRANAKAPVPDDKPIVPKEEPKAPEKQSKPKRSKPSESKPKEATPEKKPEAEKPPQQGTKPSYFSPEMHDRLTKPMTMKWESESTLVLYYGDGSASRYSVYKNSTDSKEAVEERAQRMMAKLESQQNAYKLSQATWMQTYRKDNSITRFTAAHKQNAILQHRRSMEAAIQAGLKTPQDAAEYPELQQKFGMSVEETLPPEIDRGPQAKSNLIRSVDFSKVPKKTQAELYDYLNNCNKLVAEMGIRFKTPVAFACSGAVNKKKNVRGTHSSSSNTITLKDASQCSTTLMHEIGHAFDYAMQDQRTMPRGKQQSQGRMAELSVDRPEKLPPGELGEKFKELFDTITNSEYYQAMGKDAEKNFFRYISEPTEVFARAFEVYSVAVGKRMQAEGRLSADFVKSLAPNIYQAKNPEYVAAMEKLKGAMEKYNQASVKMRDRRMTLGGQVAGEHKLPSQSDFDTDAAYQTAVMKVHVKRNEVIEERLKTDEQYQSIMAEVAAANVEKEKLMEERRTHSPYSPLKDDRKAEYEKKITDLMDFIIKNDKIRKALQKLVLFAKGENYDEEESTREGYVVGQTSSGKDVYNKFNHESHQNFDEQDNQDAAELNRRKMRTLGVRTNQEQLRRYLMRQIAGFKAKLRKAMGEGTRGGHVIGHSRSGKPIYSKFNHPMHSGFSAEDHRDAIAAHKKLLPSLKPKNPSQGQQFREHIGRQVASHEAALKPKRIDVQAEAAKIKEKMKKAIAESPVAGVDINTAEHSLDDMASRVSPWVERLRRELQGFEIGDTSRVIRLNGKWELVASQEDDGIYSGFVRNADADSGDFGQVVFEVKKMTLPQMVQALRAKEYIDSTEDRQPQDPNRGLQSAILLKLQELNAQMSRVEINQLQEKLRKFAEKR